MDEAEEVAAGVDVVEVEIVEKCELKKLIKILYHFCCIIIMFLCFYIIVEYSRLAVKIMIL